jgi:hypothetical protein
MQPYFSSTKTYLQGESPIKEKFSMSSPSPVPAPMLEQDKQQPLTNESPTDPIDE